MKRQTLYILITIFVVLMVTGCNGEEYSEVLDDNTPALVIRGKKQFVFDKMTCQESFNALRREIRVGNDNMSDYFNMKLDKLPLTEGMQVKGDLKWTTDTDIKTLKNLTFSVLKVDENQTFWLKSDIDDIYVVARMVN